MIDKYIVALILTSYESTICDWMWWKGISKMDKKQSTIILGASLSTVVVIVVVYLLVAYNGMLPYKPYATGFEHNFGMGGGGKLFI